MKLPTRKRWWLRSYIGAKMSLFLWNNDVNSLYLQCPRRFATSFFMALWWCFPNWVAPHFIWVHFIVHRKIICIFAHHLTKWCKFFEESLFATNKNENFKSIKVQSASNRVALIFIRIFVCSKEKSPPPYIINLQGFSKLLAEGEVTVVIFVTLYLLAFCVGGVQSRLQVGYKHCYS